MTTAIQHGPALTPPATGGRYFVTVQGAYTGDAGLAVAGVRASAFASTRPAKRRAELLALRSGFFDWWAAQWQREGGDGTESLVHLFDDLGRVIVDLRA